MLTFDDVLRQIVVPFPRAKDADASSVLPVIIKDSERSLSVLTQCRDALSRASLTAALPSEQLDRLHSGASTGSPLVYSELLVGVSVALTEPGRIAVSAALLAAQGEQISSTPRFHGAFLRLAREVIEQVRDASLVILIESSSVEVFASLRDSVLGVARGVTAVLSTTSPVEMGTHDIPSIEAECRSLSPSIIDLIASKAPSPLFRDVHCLTAVHISSMQLFARCGQFVQALEFAGSHPMYRVDPGETRRHAISSSPSSSMGAGRGGFSPGVALYFLSIGQCAMGAGDFDTALGYLLDALSVASPAEDDGEEAGGDRGRWPTTGAGAGARAFAVEDQSVHRIETSGGHSSTTVGGGDWGIAKEALVRARIASLLSSRSCALELPKYIGRRIHELLRKTPDPVGGLETAYEEDNWSGLRAILSEDGMRHYLQGMGVLNVALRLPEALAQTRIVHAAGVFNRISLKDLFRMYFADTTYTDEDMVSFIEAVNSSRSSTITACIDGSSGNVSFEVRKNGSTRNTAADLQLRLDACFSAQQQYKEARSKLLLHPEYIRRRMVQQQASSLAPFAGTQGPLVPSEDMDVYDGDSDQEIN